MSNLFNCEQTLECSVHIFSCTLNLCFCILMIRGLNKIMQDVNNILDQQDKLLFIICLIQFFVIFLISLVSDIILLQEILLISTLAQELLVLAFQIRLLFENQQIIRYIELGSQSIFFLYILIALILDVKDFKKQFTNCQEPFQPIFSVGILFFALLNLVMGFQIYKLIKQNQKNEIGQPLTAYDGLARITQDEITNRKIQISVIVLSQTISAIVISFWDYQQYKQVEFLCQASQSLFIFLSFIKNFLSFCVPSLAIYYVYYLRNRKYFNSNQGLFEKNLGNFYDYRSEIALVDYQQY